MNADVGVVRLASCGALKAPCRRRNFIILGGRNGVEKCRVAIKMSFFSSYYEPFFCNK